MYNFALIGDPVEHSRSPEIHLEFFKKSELKGGYICIQTPKHKIKDYIYALKDLSFKGVNITVPHKEAVLELADKKSKEAQLIGAVNTLIFKEDYIEAENTDYLGFSDSLDSEVKNKANKILLIGAGGSARAVMLALLKNPVSQEIFILTRDLDSSFLRASKLINDLKSFNINVEIKAFKQSEIENINFKDLDLVINSSPLGMLNCQENNSPLSEIEINKIKNKSCHFYDLIYNPSETAFLKLAKEKGFSIQNGELMLRLQAAHSFSLWTGVSINNFL